MSDHRYLLLEIKDGVATLVLNRPEKMNALNEAVVLELQAAFESLRDDGSVGGIIFTGAGEKAFIAGADIAELAELDPATAADRARAGQRLTRTMETLGKPILAAINGFALGGGCELAMACTFRVASENARLGQPEVKLGIIAGFGGTQRLTRLVGRGRALELLLTGDPVTAEEALRIGLVNRVFPREELMAEAEKIVRKMMAVGPVAVRYTLDAVDRGCDTPLETALETEAELFGRCFATSDMREGTKAFLEKRAAKFGGK
jgi:enoyl-CoA hydratase